MFQRASIVLGSTVESLGGDIGAVKDLYFDDIDWICRYFAVSMPEVKSSTLIAPIAVGQPDWTARRLPISLTKRKIFNSPQIRTQLPVDRAAETDLRQYYSWPLYWKDEDQMIIKEEVIEPEPHHNSPADQELDSLENKLEGEEFPDETILDYPEEIETDTDTDLLNDSPESTAHELELRSCKEFTGFHVFARSDIGTVEDIILDDDDWSMRYAVVNMRTSEHRKVLLAFKWIQNINWNSSKVYLQYSPEFLSDAPVYTDSTIITKEYESKLLSYFERQ